MSSVLETIKTRKSNCVSHILDRNCVLKYVVEGRIEGGIEGNIEDARRRGRRRKQLLYDLKETRGYCKLK